MAKRAQRKAAKVAAKTDDSPVSRLIDLTTEALHVAKTANRHNQSLRGANHYADKMAKLRADANIEFKQMSASSVGETTALAELLQLVFSVDAKAAARRDAARNLQYELRVGTVQPAKQANAPQHLGLFPLVKLNQTGRGYLVSIGSQMNECYSASLFDASAVMMRRLLESVLIEAFEAKQLVAKIKDPGGDFLQLTGIINKALAEPSWNLPRKVKEGLGKLRDSGHRSAHNRYYLATKDDLDKLEDACRESVEAFLHIAGLL